jgi:hypothetical protein
VLQMLFPRGILFCFVLFCFVLFCFVLCFVLHKRLFFIRYFHHLQFKCYPKSPLYPRPTLLSNSPTPPSWPWYSPVLGHIIFAKPRASPPNDGKLGHPLLHMQLETGALGILVSSYCCSSYSVRPLQLFGYFL